LGELKYWLFGLLIIQNLERRLIRSQRVSVIIPALNEELAIGKVISSIPNWVDEIVVVDNGSTDCTARVAADCGARVVSERERGYGAACLKGIAVLHSSDVVVFLDGDFSDDASEMGTLVEPIVSGHVDLVIGSRVRGHCASGALTLQQRFGNWLACHLMRLIWGTTWSDLGPFRAISTRTLHMLDMRDRRYGWTVEMQLKAAVHSLKCMEVPVSYRPRVGVSKISGTLVGSVKAGVTILRLIAQSAFRRRVSLTRRVVKHSNVA
jgi:hypothetical protein